MMHCPQISEFDDLSFLYDPDHFSWLERHILNIGIKRQIRGCEPITAHSEKVAEQLHRYYRVPKERINIQQ